MTVANVQITQVLLKRGNTIRSQNYTGPRSEITHDTGPSGNGPHNLRIHDGQTPGGHLMATATDIETINSRLANVNAGYGNVEVAAYLPTDSTIVSLITDKADISYVDNAIANIVFPDDNDTDYATVSYVDGAIANIVIPEVPTNISAFNNDAGYITADQVPSSYGDSNVASYLADRNIGPQLQSDYTQADTGNVTYIKNKPDLSVYATTTSVNSSISTAINNLINSAPGTLDTLGEIAANLTAEAGAIGAITNSIATTNNNVAALSANILQSDWSQANSGNITYIKNKPDLSVYATNASLQTLNANLGAYESYANTTIGGITNNITALFSNAGAQATSINLLNQNLIDANGQIDLLQANVGSFYTWANLNFGTSSYGNTDVAAYLPTYNGNISADIVRPSLTATGMNENPISNNVFWSYVPQDTNTTQVQVGWNADVEFIGSYKVTNVEVNDPFIYITLSDTGLELPYRSRINFSTEQRAWTFDTNGNLTLPYTMDFTSSPAAATSGIVFGDGTYQRTAWSGNIPPTDRLVAGDSNLVLSSNGDLTFPKGSTVTEASTTISQPGDTIQVSDLQTYGSATWGNPTIGADYISTTSWDYIGFSDETLYNNLVAVLGSATNGVYPATWADGSTLSNGFVFIQFTGGVNFQFTTVVDAGDGSNTPQPGTWYFPVTIGGSTTTLVDLSVNAGTSTWTFGHGGTLNLPASRGQIGLDGYTNGMDLYNGSGGAGYVRMNFGGQSFQWVDPLGGHIQSNGKVWLFDNDGALNLPNNGVVRNSAVNVVGSDFAQLQWVDSGNINVADPNGTPGPTNWAYIHQDGFYVETNINVGETNSLQFDNAGQLVVPGTIISNKGDLYLASTNGAANAWVDLPQDTINYNPTLGSAGNVVINTGGAHNWFFDSTGNLTLPGSQSPLADGGRIVNVKEIVGLTASSGANISGFSTVNASVFKGYQYLYPNGVSILDGIGGGTYSNIDANALFTITSITAFKDVDTVSTPPNVGEVLKWNGTKWAPGIDATTGGAGTDADTLDGQHGDYYLNYNNFSNVPDLSVYATNTSLNSFESNVGSFYTWANSHFGTSSYNDSNVASYLTSQGISAQVQSDYTETNIGSVAYIKNKPDLSVYATISSLQTLSANVGAYQTWSNATAVSQASAITTLQSQVYTNTNTAAYLASQGISAQLQSDWNQASAGNVTFIKNKPTSVSAFTNDSGYLTSASLGNVTTIVQTANVAYYPNVTSTTTNATFYPGLYNAQSGNLATYTNSGLTYNPSSGNLATTGNLVTTGDAYINGGRLRTNATTANVFNTGATTVYIAGGATIGTYIGNTAGVTQLYGNVQGSTNGFAIGYRDIPQVTFAGNTTIQVSDAGKHYYSTQSTNYTLTVANNATQSFSVGAAINIINQGTGTITIAPAAGVTMYLAGNSTSSARTLTSYGMATIQKVATDTWFAVGVGLA